MQIFVGDKIYKLDKACSKDFLRPALTTIFVDLHGERLVATDGYVMVFIENITIKRDEKKDKGFTKFCPLYIPVSIYNGLIKHALNELHFIQEKDGVYVELKEYQKFDGSYHYVRVKMPTDPYPDFERVLKPVKEATEKNSLVLSLNPELLYNLAQAMGSKDELELIFPEDFFTKNSSEKIFVKTSVDGSVYGIFSPRQLRK